MQVDAELTVLESIFFFLILNQKQLIGIVAFNELLKFPSEVLLPRGNNAMVRSPMQVAYLMPKCPRLNGNSTPMPALPRAAPKHKSEEWQLLH